MILPQITQAEELKMTLIRYIYHEVRSPLNVVFLGMEVVFDKIHEIRSKLDSKVYRDIINVINDMKNSCNDALGILDNLSIYEKIVGNNFSISISQHPVQSVVENILQPFYAQV
jgi:K+-sensing histidine kinase KdpD